MTAPVRSVTILGGGSAGWMTAAALATMLPHGVAITLVESDEIGTVGVGEATIPPIKLFNQMLGIPEAEFVAATGGSFKLGIEFVNWGHQGHRYFHPFGTFGADFDSVALHHWWLADRAAGEASSLDDLSMAWVMAKANRFAPPARDRGMVQSTFDYAYHFDAGLYAALLRRHAEANGVTRIEGKVAGVTRDGETGHVAHVTLADGRVVDGELWIDCSGFRSVLLGEAMGVAFDDWTHLLPCDRALAVPCAAPWLHDAGKASGRAGFTPYTRSTQHEAGWQWRIPLQHRIGNGYVFASRHISEDEAAATLLANLDGPALAEPRLLRFTTGRRAQAWAGNVIGIGLAAGFMEPLESTSLHLVQSAIMRLLALFPTAGMPALVRDEFNRVSEEEWRRIRDFLVLHYHLTQRRDTPLWRDCAAMTIPDELAHRIAHFRSFGRLVSPGPELFLNASWLAVHIGQGNWPQGWDPLVAARPQVDGRRYLAGLRRVMGEAAAEMPGHLDFVRRHCAAPVSA